MYADDMVNASPNRKDTQHAVNTLAKWADENRFTINEEKTVQMTFRKRGRPMSEESRKKLLSVVNSKYLGITFQTTARSYRIHIEDKAAAATRATYSISNISALSLETTKILFDAKIVPILSYSIELIWEN